MGLLESLNGNTVYLDTAPDAIQLATARVNGIDCFLTNDKGLKLFSPLRITVLDDFV